MCGGSKIGHISEIYEYSLYPFNTDCVNLIERLSKKICTQGQNRDFSNYFANKDWIFYFKRGKNEKKDWILGSKVQNGGF